MKPARSRDAGNTMLSKEFAGGILIATGANSAVGLRSTRRATSSSTRSMHIRPRPTRKATRSRWPKRGR
ncbi:phage terminase large subunit family protein [Paracoccus marcusii]|nr:phage terminase large subunit family protein [Paracoccus marcusii]